MYFIEHFLEIASKEGNVDYARMLQRDIIRVVDAVAPENGSGAANVKVVRKVLTRRYRSAELPKCSVFGRAIMLNATDRSCKVFRTRTSSNHRPSARLTRY